MKIARFDCPACNTPIEAPASAIIQGVRCPECDTGFIPEKIKALDEEIEPQHQTGKEIKVGKIAGMTPDEAEAILKAERERQSAKKEQQAHEEKWREYDDLKQDAEKCFIAGVVCLLAAMIFVGVGLANPEYIIGWLSVAGGTLTLMLVFLFFSQFLHVRAGLEKLNLKE